jgi:hypothetical protein
LANISYGYSTVFFSAWDNKEEEDARKKKKEEEMKRRKEEEDRDFHLHGTALAWLFLLQVKPILFILFIIGKTTSSNEFKLVQPVAPSFS